jgi:hypothetical protein
MRELLEKDNLLGSKAHAPTCPGMMRQRVVDGLAWALETIQS